MPTIPKDEFECMVAVAAINERCENAYCYTVPMVRANAALGTGTIGHDWDQMSRWPDWLLCRYTRVWATPTHSMASNLYKMGPGETNIANERYEDIVEFIDLGDRVLTIFHGLNMAELGPTSRGSIIGKILLELVGRLEAELTADQKAACMMPWMGQEDPPDDPAAEE